MAALLRSIFVYALIISVSVALGVVAFRLYRGLSPSKPVAATVAPVSGVIVIRANPTVQEVFLMLDEELARTSVPGVHYLARNAKNQLTEVITDSRGFRVSLPGMQAPERIDILAIGCSQTWGQGITNRETFISILGEKLGFLVTANAGVSGYSSVQAWMMLKRHLALKPKIVVYGLFQDHLRRNVNPCGNVHDLTDCDPSPHVSFDSNNLPYIKHVDRSDAGLLALIARSFDPDMRNNPFPVPGMLEIKPAGTMWSERMYKALDLMLEEMKKTADSIDAKLVVVFIPTDYPGIVLPMPTQIAATGRRLAVPILDSTKWMAPLIREGKGDKLVIPNDGHLSAFSHRMIAEELAALLGPQAGRLAGGGSR